MIFRYGTDRREHIYAQHGPEPTKQDPYVGRMEDPEMTKRVVRLLNADESMGVYQGPGGNPLAWPHVNTPEWQRAVAEAVLYGRESAAEMRERWARQGIVPDPEPFSIAGEATRPARADSMHGIAVPVEPERVGVTGTMGGVSAITWAHDTMCTCGHPFSMHRGGSGDGVCMSPDPEDTCIRFEWVGAVRTEPEVDRPGPSFPTSRRSGWRCGTCGDDDDCSYVRDWT